MRNRHDFPPSLSSRMVLGTEHATSLCKTDKVSYIDSERQLQASYKPLHYDNLEWKAHNFTPTVSIRLIKDSMT